MDGTFIIFKMYGKNIWVSDEKSTKQFNITQIIPDPADVADSELSRILTGFKDLKKSGTPGIFVTEVINPESSDKNYPKFDSPKAKEMCGLLKKGALKILSRKNITHNANILGGRFVISINNTETDAPTW